MDETTAGGLIALFVAFPGIVFGLVLLLGKWHPAQLRNGPRPDAARIAIGRYLLALNGAIAVLGVLLVLVPPPDMRPLVPYAVGAIGLVTIVGLVFVFRAVGPRQ